MESARARGKDAERQVARRLGGRRTGILGKPAPDVEGAWYVAEVKDYLKAPEVPYRILRQLRQTTPADKMALFVYKRPEWKDYVVCSLLKDFEDWYGVIKLIHKEG
uniref:Uncharacterized protein n=1 Tax=viral metagenome TaxID=1070528 RepID=A0A6H2A3V4_9ZZZZ